MPAPVLLGRTVPYTGLTVDFGRMIDYLWLKNKDAVNGLLVAFDHIPILSGEGFYIRPNSGLDVGGLNVRYVHMRGAVDIGPLLAGVVLWLNADTLSLTLDDGDPVALWPDLSGSGNNAAQANPALQPTFLINQFGTHPAISFPLSGDRSLDLVANIPNIRTVFWVARLYPGSPAAANAFWLGSSVVSDFTPGATPLMWDAGLTSPNIIAGSTRRNSAVVNGTLTNRSTVSPEIWSLVTTGNVGANRIAQDMAAADRSFRGLLAELIVFNTALADAQRRLVETYLSRKYSIPLIPPVTDMEVDMIGVNMILGSSTESVGGSRRAATPYPFLIQNTESISANRKSQSLVPRRGIYCDWITNSMGGDAGSDSPIYY